MLLLTNGAFFGPWGWGSTRIVWASHALFINNHPWGRTSASRATYVHPYPGLHRYTVAAHPEHHELIKRSEAERKAAHEGHEYHEEHHGHH